MRESSTKNIEKKERKEQKTAKESWSREKVVKMGAIWLNFVSLVKLLASAF